MIAIGIAGASGSGKSLISEELARSLPNCSVLGTDSYYRDLSGMPAADRAAVNFDRPEALDWDRLLDDFRRLRAGGRVAVPRYDFASHARLPETRGLGPCQVAVLEGLHALWDARVRRLLDLAVFVEVAQEVCLARRIRRDVAERGRTETSVREQWRRHAVPMYREHVLPKRRHADLALDGTRPPGASVASILQALEAVRAEAPPARLHSGV